MFKRKEFMRISPKKTLKYTSEQSKPFSFSCAFQYSSNFKEENSSLDQKTISNSYPVQTLPNYILSKKIEEGAFSPMFDGEMIYNGEIFPFSFKNICEKNVLLFFCPFIFDPKVLDLLQMIEEYFKFKEKCSDSNKKITDNLALAIISIDSLQAILEFYKNQTQLCRDIYLISDFKQEIYEKFELKNEGSFIECVFLINFSKIIVKKKEDLFQFDQIIDFYTINI